MHDVTEATTLTIEERKRDGYLYWPGAVGRVVARARRDCCRPVVHALCDALRDEEAAAASETEPPYQLEARYLG